MGWNVCALVYAFLICAHPQEITRHSGSHIALDFITGLHHSERHTVILTVVDRFSKPVQKVLFARYCRASLAVHQGPPAAGSVPEAGSVLGWPV